jgi:myosin heavy subunit
MTLPQFKDEDIIQSFHRLETPYLSFDKLNKNKFCLIHTQCPVNYTITSFKTKNQDKIND